MIRTQDKRDLIIDLTKQKAVLRSQRLKMLSRVSDTLGNMKISTPKATLQKSNSLPEHAETLSKISFAVRQGFARKQMDKDLDTIQEELPTYSMHDNPIDSTKTPTGRGHHRPGSTYDL